MKTLLAVLCAVLLASFAAVAAHASSPFEDGGTTDNSDPKTPKTVVSTQLESFQADFYYGGRFEVRNRIAVQIRGSSRPIGDYRFTAVRQKEFAHVTADFLPRNERLPRERYDFTAPHSLLDELHRALIENELPKVNGFSKRNSALGTRFAVDVKYASGETIRASGRGGARCAPPVDLGFLIETFRALVDRYAPADQRPSPGNVEKPRTQRHGSAFTSGIPMF